MLSRLLLKGASLQCIMKAVASVGTTPAAALPRCRAPTPLARPLCSGAWAPGFAPSRTHQQRQQQQGGVVRSYTYEAADAADTVEIGEVDFDPAAANTGAWQWCLRCMCSGCGTLCRSG